MFKNWQGGGREGRALLWMFPMEEMAPAVWLKVRRGCLIWCVSVWLAIAINLPR